MKFSILTLLLLFSFHLKAQVVNRFVESELQTEIPDLQALLDASSLEKKSFVEGLSLAPKEKISIIKELNSSKTTIEKMVKNGDIIASGPIFNFVDSLLSAIKSKNSEISSKAQIYIVRDLSANAFNTGDNIIFFNLGLLYRLKTVEEIIYVICHELGHDLLDHGMKSVVGSRELFYNDSIKKEMRGRLQRRYGTVSGINELMIPLLVANQKNSRDHEYEADSLGFAMYRKMNLNLNHPINTFDVFKNIGHERSVEWDQKNPFLKYCSIDTNQIKGKYKGSSMGSFTAEKKPYEEELKSHPYEDERKVALLRQVDTKVDTLSVSKNNSWKFWIENEMIHEAFRQQDLTQMTYYILHSEPSYIDSSYVNELFAMSYMIFAYTKESKQTGAWLGFSNRDKDNEYNDVLEYLRKLTPLQTFEIASCLGTKMNDLKMKTYFSAFQAAYEMNHEQFKVQFQKIREFDQVSVLYRMLLDHNNKYRLTLKF